MNMVKWFTESIVKLWDKNAHMLDIVYYCLLGLLALVFVVVWIAGANNKELKGFKRAARRFIDGGERNVDNAFKKMPQSVQRAYNRGVLMGGNPADFLTLETCVAVPFRVSLLSRFARAMFAATVFVTLLGYFISATCAQIYGIIGGTVLLLLCGGALVFFAWIVSAASYRSAVGLYNDLVKLVGRVAAPAEARPQPAAQAVAQQMLPLQAAQTAQPVQLRPLVPTVDYAAAEARAMTAEPEDVVARIDRISREGAPLSTMREVALLLQQERAKPENKTPEQQRRLNEALSKLLKAMSMNRG